MRSIEVQIDSYVRTNLRAYSMVNLSINSRVSNWQLLESQFEGQFDSQFEAQFECQFGGQCTDQFQIYLKGNLRFKVRVNSRDNSLFKLIVT